MTKRVKVPRCSYFLYVYVAKTQIGVLPLQPKNSLDNLHGERQYI